MSLHCGFLFPKKDFKLIFLNTIGYVSDNIFYRLNMNTFQTEIVNHPQGRSYQAFASNFKRQLVVLVDYGKNPTFSFEYKNQNKSFQLNNVCELQVLRIQLSLDGNYLAVVCGVPNPRIIFIDIPNRRVLGGTKNFIGLEENYKQLQRIQFNPSNHNQLALQYRNRIQIHELKQCFQLDSTQQIHQTITIKKIDTIQEQKIQFFIWDEINNIYISNKKEVYIYSTDTKSKVLSCDIEIDLEDENENAVSNILLTKKHIIVFYKTGRIQWLNKYYPDLMEEEDISMRPFYLDKYYQTNRKVLYSTYDGQFSKIFISFDEGCFGILPKPAESNEPDEQQQQTGKKSSRDNSEKKLSLQLILSQHYHSSPIVLIHEFSNSSACVTLSSVGRLIYWSIKAQKQIQTHSVHSDIQCASVNKVGNVLATGHSNGIIRFYSIAKPENIFLFKQFKMTKSGPIDQVLFSSNGQELAVFSKTQNKVFYILTSLSMEFEVLGFVNLPFSGKYISWMGQAKSNITAKYEYLLVNIGFGVMMINSPAAVPTKKRGKQLDLKCEIYATRTDPYQTLVTCLPSGQLLVTGKDNFFKKYKQPEDLVQKIDFKSKIPPNAPLQEIQGHDFQTIFLKTHENYLLSGGKQGKIHLRDYNNFKEAKQINAYGWKTQNLNYISGSQSKGVIYVAGKDGSFYIWKIGNVQIKNNDNINLPPPNYKKISSKQNLKYFQVSIQQDYLQRMKQTIGQKKKLQFEKLQKIRTELKNLLEENEKHQDLQKLTRDQFAIDLETKEIVAKQGEQKCKQIVQQSKKKILYNEVYAKRLKQITWDRMDVHLSAINGIKNNYLVYNYQLRKISAVEKRKVKLILDLRRAQKKEQKKRTIKNIDFQDFKNKNIVNGGIPTPLIMTQIQNKKEDSKKEEKKKKKQDQVPGQSNVNNGAPANDSVDELPQEQEFSLIYSSFQLFNSNAKRNQIIMMKNLIQIIKKSFNKEFNKHLKLRQNQNQIINDKNKRIIQICEQLKRQPQTILGRQNILETNEGVLQVKNSQIPFQRYLSREEREKLQKQRLKQQERLRKLAQDDSAQRALQKMMSGTLEEKKVSALQITVERQKWMDKPIEQMTEDEKLKYKEYQSKKQKAEQQKQRLVKKLQAQLRKLKQQIDEIMERYDQKLFQLLKKKIQYDYRIQQQELYCARLALSMLSEEQEQKRHSELKKQIQESKRKLQQIAKNKQYLQSHQAQFENQKQSKRQQIQKERLGEFQSKIKTIQKSVFQQYHTNLKKRRQMQEKLLQSNPNYRNQIIPLDPMKQIQSKLLSQQIQNDFSFFVSEIKTLQQTFDIPENTIERLLQNRFNLRREQHYLNEKQKILAQSINNLQQSLTQKNKQILKDEEEINQIEKFLIKCKSDLDLQIRIKQGQVEINNDKPVPDLDNALLIAKSQIDDKNFKIKQQANEKIAVMKQIKTCKIKVTQQTLNLQKKQQHIDKLTAMIKQIQMLKVKKEMQVALSKKDSKMNQNEIKSLKQQIQKVRKEGEKRIVLYEDKIKKIQKEIQTIRKQNKQLESQKWNLEGTVKQREKIKDMMCGDGQSGQEAAEKFDQISINRKLFDKAKQQTEEIQLLREQLSKLKAKTFANFSNVQR